MNIIKHSKKFLIGSAIVLLPGVLSLIFYGLKLSADFTGGSVFEYQFEQSLQGEEAVARENEILNIFTENQVEVRETVILSENNIEIRSEPVDTAKNQEIKAIITETYANSQELRYETIGAVIGSETIKSSLMSLAAALTVIVIYIAYAFRNIPKPYSSFKFGLSAIIAMVHDVLFVLGIYSLLGKFYGVQVDALFITALLTVIGFSIHDTIVVFDRIRENLNKLPKNMPFGEKVNYSVVETMNRSLTTSLTVLMVLFSMVFLGGESIKFFVLALLLGIASGAYSSLFIASPVLALWEGKKQQE